MVRSKALRQAVVVLALVSFSFVSCRPEKTPDNEDYDAGGDDVDIEVRASPHDVPEFISTNQTYRAIAGRPFQLGCQVNKKLDGIQLMWSVKYDHDAASDNPKVIKVGDHWIQPDLKNHLEINPIVEDNSTVGDILTIKKVAKADAGKYICTITHVHPKIVEFVVKVVDHNDDDDDDSDSRPKAATSAAASSRSVFTELTAVASLMVATVLAFRGRQ